MASSQYYFEYGQEETTNTRHYKYSIEPGNKITLFSLDDTWSKFVQKYDQKFDDGSYNTGNIRSKCGDGYTTYDTAVLKNIKCSIVIHSLKL